MRKQKSGCILQVSSVGCRLGVPGNAAYQTAKWAVGGFTEAIAPEPVPFGVKVCALEPGVMRTNWGKRQTLTHRDFYPSNEASVGTFIKMSQGDLGRDERSSKGGTGHSATSLERTSLLTSYSAATP